MSLTPEEAARYARHTVLPEVGIEGQCKLKAASLLVVGAGGLGSAIAELSAEGPLASLVRVGIQDVFGTSGDPDDLMEHYGLTGGDIAREAEGLLSARR
jgi:tRNA A37 threonylcarbamoyladenosine dehydratase